MTKLIVIPKKSQKRGEISADNLMNAAVELFLEQGFERTTVDDIVARAGMAKGAFYHHFETKTALLTKLRAAVIARFQEGINEALQNDPASNLLLRLETWVIAACKNYIEMDPLHELVFNGPDDLARWSATGEPFMDDLISMLRQGNEEGLWSVEETHITATFLFRGILGVIDDFMLHRVNIDTVSQSLVRIVLSVVNYR